MKIDRIIFELCYNMYENLTEYCKYVAIETTLIDIHGNIVLSCVAELYIYVSWKFHEDSSNSFCMTVK